MRTTLYSLRFDAFFMNNIVMRDVIQTICWYEYNASF